MAYNPVPLALSVSTKTAAYTVTASDDAILCNGTTAAFTVTLPTAVGWTKRVVVKKIDASANAITIATSPNTQTIDGATTKVLSAQYASVDLVSDGANWQIV